MGMGALNELLDLPNMLGIGHFTSQERKRVLGQSGDFIFEKHYQTEFIQRDLQHVVLLRPPQEGLLQRAAGMLRNRDPLAPSNLTDEQLRAIRQHPEILELRREKRELKEEMRSLAGTIQNARDPFPDLYRRHDEISKKLTKLRKVLRDNTQQTARKDYFHTAPVLEIDRQIQQLLGKSGAEDCDVDSAEDGDEDWRPPVPDYVFPERARLVESFYGPDGECFDEDRLLVRRIQVTEDLVALAHLCEPNRRGKRANWDGDDEQSEKSEEKEAFLLEEKSLECSTDVCIICCGISRRSPSNPHPHKFPSKRKDSLRRHLIDSHLMNAHDGVRCTWETCGGLPTFIDVAGFLAHAANVHHYDLHIKLERIPKRQRPSRDETSSSSSPIRSLKSSRLGTETPASSVDIEIGKIDPRLLTASNTKSNETYRRSQRLKSH
jgi:PAS domain-containing protein